MRLSNMFIYGSLAIVVSLSIGFLFYQTFIRTDDSSQSPKELANRIAELEKENEGLLAESAKTIDNLSKKVTSLNDGLHRSSKLVMEKDNEIAQLKLSFESSEFHVALAKMLNCQPGSIQESVEGLVRNHLDLQRRFQIVNQQLAAANSMLAQASGNKPGESNENDQSEEKVEKGSPVKLNVPQNHSVTEKDAITEKDALTQKDSGNQNDNFRTEKDSEQQQVKQESPEGNEKTQSLLAKINELEVQLRNREKLLYEQTSLIEDLKKKNNRIETGFRTGKNALDSVPANSPFRDRGTFPVKN